MITTKLRNAIINDRNKHPERANATLERIIEVLENVLGPRAETVVKELEGQSGVNGMREPLTAAQGEKILFILKNSEISSADRAGITDQLMCSEISTNEAVELHKKFKIPVSHLEMDIVPVRGSGSWIMDTKGRWFLDMDSNYSATNLGMDNEEIARGLYNQAKLLISMKEDRVQIARTRFLRDIHQMMPDGLENFYWQNSGGEAVDKALKIAKAHTGTTGVIAFKNGFHGRTHGALSVTWNRNYRMPFGLEDEGWVHFAEFNNIDSVKKLLDETGSKIVIMEMVQGEEAGNRSAEQEFITQLWEEVHKRGGVIIDDEIQAGFGRTATKEGEWFTCQGYGVVPDIMTIGKSFGGGYPVTAVVTKDNVSDSMEGGYDGSTFGGNPMAMVSALIATRQMREKKVTQNVIERSRQLFEGLEKIKEKHDIVGEIRGRGLMIGISLTEPKNVELMQEELKNQGIKTTLGTREYLRILPPTVITEDEVDTFLRGFEISLEAIKARHP